MFQVNKDELLAFLKQLVEIESVVNTDGEKVIAHSLYTMISSFPYFLEHPDQVMIEQTIDDERERYNVLAYIKGTKKQSDKTVLLMGHVDTVGIDDFGQFKDLACSPDELKEALKNEELPEQVKKHLESDDWMFGRGVLDMKSGLASHLYILKYFSEHPDELEGNLVFIAECDEEDSSNGILSGLKTLNRWKEEHNFNYVAAINGDFVSPRYEGDDNRYIYKGTVGKLLPAFFITGAETHVGSAFEGLDPNLIAAELTRQIDYNPELCNEAYGEITVPPVSLKQTDLKPTYTVQTALSAYVYYNFFTHSWSPREVLERLRSHALVAFRNALQTYHERYKTFCEISKVPYREMLWEPRVLLYEELEALLIEKHGEKYVKYMDQFKTNLLDDDSLDIRMYAAKVVEEAWKWMDDQSPAIILFYASLYSPRNGLTGKTTEEQMLIEAVDYAIEKIQPQYEHPIVTRNFFPYISDMSFVAMSDDDASINAVTRNNPAWGSKHFINFQDIRDINVPVINIGPYGIDAHKRLERVELTFSLDIVPRLTYEVIKYVLK